MPLEVCILFCPCFRERCEVMNRLILLTAFVAVISGCSSIDSGKISGSMPPVVPLLEQKPYNELTATEQRIVLEGELQIIGNALQKYAADNNGALPPSLTALVKGNYLEASALVSSADPTKGKEGGVPDKYETWGQAKDTDEPGFKLPL